MIKKNIAEEVKEVVLACSAQLDRSVGYALQSAPERQASLYRSLAGQVMGLLFTEILMPIYTTFPELEPEYLRKAKTEEVKLLPLDVGLRLLEVHSSVVSSLTSLREELVQSNEDDVKQLVLALNDVAEALRTMKEYLVRSCPGVEEAPCP